MIQQYVLHVMRNLFTYENRERVSRIMRCRWFVTTTTTILYMATAHSINHCRSFGRSRTKNIRYIAYNYKVRLTFLPKLILIPDFWCTRYAIVSNYDGKRSNTAHIMLSQLWWWYINFGFYRILSEYWYEIAQHLLAAYKNDAILIALI